MNTGNDFDGSDQVDLLTSNHDVFCSYYEKQSQQAHFIATCDYLKSVLTRFYFSLSEDGRDKRLTVVDVGCGPGTQAIVWALDGHRVYGVDVSERLIEMARERMRGAGVTVDFRIGGASRLPLPDLHADICLLPELLEHVPDWRVTLEECHRVLKAGGMLYVATSNALCPVQEEYSLPLYSWYPGFLKRICERKAMTTHRHWVNYATYPAVNWFTNPGLTKTLTQMGFRCYDRFDIMDLASKPKWVSTIISLVIKRSKLIRMISYMFTTSTLVVAIKPEKS